MKISGFTIVRNAEKYYFPIKESIESILPIVDEFIVALGDSDDETEAIIKSINSDKIKIHHRTWNLTDSDNSHVYSAETNFALNQCKGDWCFYIQADEVIHENDLSLIKQACEENLNDKRVNGLLFNYYHFWGDYNHYLPYHGWYRQEIRIIRNHQGIKSIGDAQSFRMKDDTKIPVKSIPAHIYHYGWVRPPEKMRSKKKEQDISHYNSTDKIDTKSDIFNYGALGNTMVFKGSHPKVMAYYIKNLSWSEQLNLTKKASLNRPKMKHEKFKYRVISWIENHILGGKGIFTYKNWIEIK